MAGVIALVMALALGLALLGATVVNRARAQNAADAAALGAAVRFDAADAERTAGVVARANGAEIVEVRREGLVTVVRIRCGSIEAVAAARPAGSLPRAEGRPTATPQTSSGPPGSDVAPRRRIPGR